MDNMDTTLPMVPAQPVVIDGSTLEGGGQILRSTTACSLITRKPLRVAKIRANRPKPGLSAQHVSVVALLSSMLPKTLLKGGEIGSCALEITPPPYPPSSSSPSGAVFSSSYHADCGTAGAISLITQAALPCLVFSPINSGQIILILKGGTNVNFSPPIDHTEHVLLPLLRSIGFNVQCEVKRRGYYPVGGGEVHLKITPTLPSSALSLTDRGQVNKVACIIFGEGPSYDIAAKELEIELKTELEKLFADLATECPDIVINVVRIIQPPKDLRQNKQPKKGNSSLGAQVCAYTTTNMILSANHLECSRNNFEEHPVKANIISGILGKLSQLVKSGACVDELTADQLIIYMAFLPHSSKLLVEPPTEHSSLHLQTSIEMVKKMSNAEFTIESTENGCRLIVCTQPDAVAGSRAMEPIVSTTIDNDSASAEDNDKNDGVTEQKTANIDRLLSIAHGKAAENRAAIDRKIAASAAHIRPHVSMTSSPASTPLEKRVRKKR